MGSFGFQRNGSPPVIVASGAWYLARRFHRFAKRGRRQGFDFGGDSCVRFTLQLALAASDAVVDGVHQAAGLEKSVFSREITNSSRRGAVVFAARSPAQPPERLLVIWDGQETSLPLNVEDAHLLPPPARLEQMSADDMLWILAAADPSAAFRAWARDQQSPENFDADLDSATPVDLDPLRRHDLQATFLHRIRRRARILAPILSPRPRKSRVSQISPLNLPVPSCAPAVIRAESVQTSTDTKSVTAVWPPGTTRLRALPRETARAA